MLVFLGASFLASWGVKISEYFFRIIIFNFKEIYYNDGIATIANMRDIMENQK